MQQSYILDTSALRAIGRSDLEAISQQHSLLLSPVSFWEILCHLDETTSRRPAEQQAFDYGKALLGKCGVPTLLEDPFVCVASRSGVPSLANPTRFEDRQGIPLILTELQQSSSLSDFTARGVILPGSSPRLVGDIARRTRDCLSEVEQSYQKSIQETARRIVGEHTQEQIRGLRGTGFYHLALRAVAVSLYQEAVGTGLPDRDLFDRVTVASYIAGGYLIARTLRALNNNGFKADEIAVDPNDTEDFMISMHMSWNEPCTLVTNDGGTVEAVGRSLQELQAHMTSLSISTSAQARVIDVPTFREETRV